MKLIIAHHGDNSSTATGPRCNRNGPLAFALSTPPIAQLALRYLQNGTDEKTTVAVSQKWRSALNTNNSTVTYYQNALPIYPPTENKKDSSPLVIQNAKFVPTVNTKWLKQLLNITAAPVVTVNIAPNLAGYSEKLMVTSQAKVAGVRRLYNNSAQPAATPADWPHMVFVQPEAIPKILAEGTLPASFTQFLNKCSTSGLTVQSLDVAGAILNLDTEPGLLAWLNSALLSSPRLKAKINHSAKNAAPARISPHARLLGKVLLGQNVRIGPGALIIGPTIIADNVKISPGVVIKRSIIGSQVVITQNTCIENRILLATSSAKQLRRAESTNHPYYLDAVRALAQGYNGFRIWPSLSYPATFKRIADIFAALLVLILFAPVLPIIALAIKLTSDGPVFFTDKRQGLHGREFRCLKFRTMFAGAARLQPTLRFMNQADGPQFKMQDDPRVSAVGQFLRSTSIDEIPQFINVLLGQMSLVGPRPSPEAENSLCPTWRYARLSVRPGITGLWQISRTRLPHRDFQEWLYYDIEYVRKLSLGLDFRICCKTVIKLLRDFARQF